MPALSRRIRKFATVATVVIVSAGGAAAGVGTASASPASRPAPPTYQTDHQLCYGAAPAGPGIKLPPAGSVTLDDQFGSFSPAFGSSKPDLHCNPVEKILPDGQRFGITNPSAHLLCWQISGDTTAKPPIEIANQFGSAYLALDQANQLCLPTWNSLTGPPKMTPRQPPGLSHYTCYPVAAVTSGGYTAPGLELQDEFAAQPVAARVTSFTPGELCVPTTKIVATPAGSKVYPVVPGASELLCFHVTQTPKKTPVFDQNQFTGPGVQIKINKTLTLCVPSTSPHLYWADSGSDIDGTIMKANRDGTDMTTLQTGQNLPRGVAVDSSHIYWTNSNGGTIMRANLDGTGVTTLETGQSTPGGIAVDSSHIYWTSGDSGTIMRANLDGTGVTTLETGQKFPGWVAVDSSHIYWTDVTGGTVMKANLNGTGVTTLETGQSFPEGIAVDSSHIYWADSGGTPNGLIIRANLDGTGAMALATLQDLPLGVAVDSSHIYWADSLAGTIMRANLDGTGATTLETGQNGPAGVAVGLR
jgi:sugar lactone lactonase YvrE